jgi:Domain of unknown function (DUF4190)
VSSDVKSNVSTATSAAASAAASAIENEIANYRAISPLAIICLILGVFSVLSFANIYFIAIGVAAIVTGVLANRTIQRYPELYTGKGFAQAGIALGLIFGTSAVTTLVVADLIRTSEAKKFAAIYENALKKGTREDLLWFTAAPEMRKNKTPQQVADEMESGAKEKMMIEQHHGPLLALKKTIDSPNSDVHFAFIEATEDDGKLIYGGAVYKIHTPDLKTGKEKEEYALAVMKAEKLGGKYTWWVEAITYPYQIGTHVKTEPAADDGHGHGGH